MSPVLLKLGLIGAVILVAAIWHKIDRNAAYGEGQIAERVIWQQLQAEADARADADRREAQAEISRIETDYWQRSTAESVKSAELKKALENEKANGRACIAATRELRDKLNAIGRRH